MEVTPKEGPLPTADQLEPSHFAMPGAGTLATTENPPATKRAGPDPSSKVVMVLTAPSTVPSGNSPCAHPGAQFVCATDSDPRQIRAMRTFTRDSMRKVRSLGARLR